MSLEPTLGLVRSSVSFLDKFVASADASAPRLDISVERPGTLLLRRLRDEQAERAPSVRGVQLLRMYIFGLRSCGELVEPS